MDVAALFDEHHEPIYRYLVRYTGDAELAADAAQEAFIRLLERPPRHGAHLRAWLYKVATNAARERARTERKRGLLLEGSPDRVPVGTMSNDPDVALERKGDVERVRRALAGLDDRERTVLLMREEGFKHREIAEAVGTTTGSVGTMIARALDKLAGALQLDTEAP